MRFFAHVTIGSTSSDYTVKYISTDDLKSTAEVLVNNTAANIVKDAANLFECETDDLHKEVMTAGYGLYALMLEETAVYMIEIGDRMRCIQFDFTDNCRPISEHHFEQINEDNDGFIHDGFINTSDGDADYFKVHSIVKCKDIQFEVQ